MRGFVTKSGLLLALAFSLGASAACAQELPSPQAREQILQLLEQQSLYRDRVNWAALRSALQDASGDAEKQIELLKDAIRQSSAGHGRWQSAQELARKLQLASATTETTPRAESASRSPAIDPRIGRVQVAPYRRVPALSREQQNSANRQFARRLQSIIREQDNGGLCGWIVDLRGNTGGDMWPMLLGVAPLLTGTVNGDGVVGSFVTGAGKTTWRYREGQVFNGDHLVLNLGETPYGLRHPGAPVAVLIDRKTMSSGEAIALAFRGQPATRSFGQASGGYSTANRVQKLADGSELVLTVSIMADRTGHGDGTKIIPDEVVLDAQASEQSAITWLLTQPPCQQK